MYHNIKSFRVSKVLFLILLLPAIMVSCRKSDWYDIKSSSALVIPSTVSDFQALLDNPNMNYNYPSLGEIGCDDHYISDANFSTITPKERNAYTWSHNEPYLNLNDWSTGATSGDGVYVRVYEINLVLDGLKKLSSTVPQYNNVKGQALFQRAKNFYELAQVYAPFYDKATASGELGIPLRLESDINIPSVRSTLQQTYDQIFADLKEAEQLLPVSQEIPTRGTKPALYALLARIYLSIEDYTQAGFYANESLKLYSDLLNYNDLAVNTSPVFPIYNKEVMFHSLMVSGGAITYQSFFNKDLYNSYDKNDLRKSKFFVVAPDSSITVGGTYFYTAPFNGLATNEMYLIRAECYARAGKPAEAMDDLNKLLRNRWVTNTYTDMTASSADDALIKVLTERRKELIKHGLRWTDLRRLNRDARFKKTITRTVAGKTYTLEPDSYKYTFPIPDDVIQKSGMQQNKGWQ